MKLNWSTKKLGEIRKEIKKEKAPVEAMPYIEIGNVNIESKKVNFTEKGAVKGSIFCPEESILISRVRPTRGAVVLTDRKYAISSAFTIIKPKINSRLLFYFLAWNKKFFEYLGNLQKGTSYPSVKESDILDFEISFPEDKVEQQKIVYILDNIQNMIRVQEKIIEKTKELKKSMMADLFKYGGPSFRKGRKLKKTEIGEIPENWGVMGLREIAETKSGGTPNREKNEYYGGKIPWVKSGELKDNIIFDTEEKITEAGLRNSAAVIFPKGTFLIAMYGATAGKTALLGIDASTNQAVCAIFPKNQSFVPEYLRYYFIQARERLLGARYGGAQPNINQNIINSLIISLPSLLEQREIADILQTIDQKIEIEQKKKTLYEELFKTMLNKLMTGEIKVDNLKI